MRPVQTVRIAAMALWFVAMMTIAIRRRFLRTLERAGAFDRGSAIDLPAVKPWKAFMRARLVRTGAVVATLDGRYWLDRERAATLLRIRRRRGLTAVAIVFALGGLAFLLARWAP